jgi:hypothetical protein
MHRRQYQRLAVIIGQIVNHDDRLKTADSIADLCKDENPAFNQKLFFAAIEKAHREIEAARRHHRPAEADAFVVNA